MSGVAPTQKVHDVVKHYRPAKQFAGSRRSDGTDAHVTSLDFDDTGEHAVAAGDDETMQVFDVREGRRAKAIPSRKYGVHLARFTHHARQVLFASTKQEHSLRLLELHGESFVRYFTAHTAPVTGLAVSPASDAFLSCGDDDMACLWDLNSRSPQGRLKLVTPRLATFDPSGVVMAVASPATSSILMYDVRNYDKAPFQTIDTAEHEERWAAARATWTRLEISNDGKGLLLATDGPGHFVFNSYEGSLTSFLVGKTPATAPASSAAAAAAKPRSPGDACFTQDGRFIVGGGGGGGGSEPGLHVWDVTLASGGRQEPTFRLPSPGIATAVVQVNPRFNMMATADTRVCFWRPQDQIKTAEL